MGEHIVSIRGHPMYRVSDHGIKNPHNIRVAISRGTKSHGYYWSREEQLQS